MSIATRFAPSPTGRLHVGNARIALINWLLARSSDGGRFVLRVDDTDPERSRAELIPVIEDDLRWLGLDWDVAVRQSERLGLYEAAARDLREAGRLYPCYETPEELEHKRKRLLALGRPPIYDRGALKLTDEDKRRLEGEGRRPHWRFLLESTEIAWQDAVRGPVSFHARNLSDPILVREDGSFLYTLPSVVDDIDLGISAVVRGEDHVTNTAVQIQIFEALSKDTTGLSFAHLPLLVDAHGKSLSKRLGSLSLSGLRGDGLEPMALNSLLATLGSMDSIEAAGSLSVLQAEFSLARFSRNPPRFEEAELWRLNAQVLHQTPFAAVRARLGIDGADEAFWNAVRPNLATLDEAREWWAVCHEPLRPTVEELAYLAQAAQLLPEEPWDSETWSAWTGALKAATGRKGKALFHPLRLALTGREHGPELRNLLPVIGRRRTLARLRGEAA